MGDNEVIRALEAALALLALALMLPGALLADYLRPSRARFDVDPSDDAYGRPFWGGGYPDCARCGRPAREHVETRADWKYSLAAQCPVQGRFGVRRYAGAPTGIPEAQHRSEIAS